MKRKLLIFNIVLIVFLSLYSIKSYAITISDDERDETASELVSDILGEGISAKNAARNGTIYSFSDGDDSFGISSGIILDTSGMIDDGIQDEDLKNILGYDYGGHTSKLEFELTATGKLLNFNYAFASSEFDQSPCYNDAFGLFVSVNGGAYENIALIQRSDESLVPVTITNLRAGIDGTELDNGADTNIGESGTQYSLFKVANIGLTNGTNGVSKIFNAQKAVEVGDKVKIKFVICDVTDSDYDSFVAIEAGSLSFDPPGAKSNFKDEELSELNPGSEYWITSEGETYKFNASSEGTIPLVGTDKDGNTYNFLGKSLQIVRKGEGKTKDSEPQQIEISTRPQAPNNPTIPTNTPKDINGTDVTTTTSSITVKAVSGQEYSLDGINWFPADTKTGEVIFKGLTPNTEYTIYTRIAATEEAFASNSNEGISVKTLAMVKDLDHAVENYEGIYDGEYHTGSVTSIDGTRITYSNDLNGTYTEDIIKFKDAGNHDVYFCIEKEDYYYLYGKFTVTINKRVLNITPLEDQGKKANAKDKEIKYTYSNNLSGEEPVFIGSLSRAEGEKVGEYEIFLGSLALKENDECKPENYELVITPNIYYTITKSTQAPETSDNITICCINIVIALSLITIIKLKKKNF